MTCIVGVQHEGNVYIGGDSAGVSGLDIVSRADKKVFRNNEYIMGFTSSFRMGQLLHYSFDPPPAPTKDLERFMVTDFIDAIRECFKDGGWMTTNSGQDEGGTFLVGVHGQLYAIYDDFQIGRSGHKYDAVGCGDSYALGSLHSTAGQEPVSRVRCALKAAERHSAGVSGPFTILKG